MLFKFLKKQKEFKSRKKVVSVLIKNLKLPEKQKTLYLEALEVIDENGLSRLYKTVVDFATEIEEESFKQIRKDNFSFIDWMNKKEAEEKQKEINTFNFLINNL